MSAGTAMGLGLWLPEECREEIEPHDEAEHDVDVASAFRKRLKGVDARLDLMFVKRGAKNFPVGGRWYITRQGDHGRAQSFWVIQTDQEGYCAPTEQHFQALMARDSWGHPDVWQRMRRQQADEKRAIKSAGEAKHTEFREKLEERLAHNHGSHVAVSAEDKEKLA